MNKIGALVGLVLVAIAVLLFLLRDKPVASSTTAAGSSSATGSATPTPAQQRGKPVDRVGKVSPEERKRLADRIASARARRAATSAPPNPSLPTPAPQLPANDDAQLVRTTMKDAMHEIIPYVAECYEKAMDKLPARIKVVADMTLTGDPDIGTIIDTKGLLDGEGNKLEPGFDLCLRDAFVSLQIPPLSEGGEVDVTYPFLFSNGDPDAPPAGSHPGSGSAGSAR